MGRRWAIGAAAVAAALACPAAAEAAVRGLLIGVSDYHALDDAGDLKGPGNDVAALAAWLVERGASPADVAVLADAPGPLPAGVAVADPSRAAILDALDRLARDARPGDQVMVHFSGHGAQQPDTSGDENGGQDEVLLPRDVGRFDPATGLLDGAIVDDEFGARILAVRRAGASVFVVVDACHSATGLRGRSDTAVRSRTLPAGALGLPERAPPRDGAPAAAVPVPDAPGDYVAFYAAQPWQRALEGDLGGGVWGGAFTASLVKALRAAPDASYADVLRAASDDLKARRLGGAQQPDFEGTALESPVLGTGGGGARLRVTGGRIAAGALAGLTAGSVVSLHADATGPAVLGYARVEAPGATDAALATVERACETDCALVPDALAAARYAAVVEPAADLSVTFSEPISIGDPHPADAAWIAAVDDLRRLGSVRFAPAGYDVALVLDGGRLAIGDAEGVIDARGPGSSIRLDAPPDGGPLLRHLEGALRRIARVHALYAATAATGGGLLAGSGKGVETRMEIAPASAADRDRPRCPGRPSAPPADRRMPADAAPRLSHCDVVVVTVSNASAKPQDVTVLYVDGAFGISPLWPGRGLSNRLAPGESVEVPFRIVARAPDGGPAPTGEERVLVLAVPVADDTAERVVLTGLAQPGLTRGLRGPTEDWLRSVLDGPKTRGGITLRKPPPLSIAIRDLVVVPPDTLD